MAEGAVGSRNLMSPHPLCALTSSMPTLLSRFLIYHFEATLLIWYSCCAKFGFAGILFMYFSGKVQKVNFEKEKR